MKKSKAVLFGSLMAVLLGCQSSNHIDPFNEALLTSNRGWKVTAITISPLLGGVSDYFGNILSDCDRDNIIIFRADKSYTIDEGATKCDSADPQVPDEGAWSISPDKKTLIQSSSNPDTISIPLKIVSLTSTTFVFTTQINLLGTNYVLTNTLTAIK